MKQQSYLALKQINGRKRCVGAEITDDWRSRQSSLNLLLFDNGKLSYHPSS
ncbi:hypothetical protein IQ268_10210 [Oculatella sp. LEGE 06141]|uniref:hypothetical protein n=1 Tax=Oculatella sp. LEGE 06141 TaxID=1828648 RepID=UPI00187EDE7E|nr:hypothetical protein [Oculatella sp. LEGE 06141]MBE9178934.1 hypothetical protein [Oculatella sp. LEGE 06141]